MDILILFNEPALAADDPASAQESGVLEAVEAVERSLVRAGGRVSRLGVGDDAPRLMRDLLARPRPDAVFNLFEGLGGRGRGEAAVAGMLDLLGWSYTGSPADCLELVRHKPRTKWLLTGCGISTPRALLVEPGEALSPDAIARLCPAPWIVKPAHEDASLGIGPDSVVDNPAALEAQIARIAERFGPVLVEQFIAGREFNVAIVEHGGLRALPLAEIEFAAEVAGGWGIVTYEAKWSPGSADDVGTPVRCPARVEPALAKRLEQLALAAWRACGCRDYARVDLRVSADGTPYVLEINGNPDLSPSAGLAHALAAAGIEYHAFIHRLALNASQREKDHR